MIRMSSKTKIVPILKSLNASISPLNLGNVDKESAKRFFKALSEEGLITINLFAMNKKLCSRKAYLREDVENPSTRTGKENFFEVTASFPLSIAKKAVSAELVVQGIQLALSSMDEVGRINGNRMMTSWRLKIK